MTSTMHGRSNATQPAGAAQQAAERGPVVPPASATVRLRNAFTITSRGTAGGSERHMITAPRRGPERGQARRAILAVLHRAEERQHRVWFLITFGNYSRLPLGLTAGYDPTSVIAQCRAKQDDPYVWFQEQFQRHHQAADAHAIIGVEIATWPPLTGGGRPSRR
jgi:hypothetical protein